MKLSRLRRGEVVAAAFAVTLLLVLFLLPWFRFNTAAGGHVDADGWNSLPLLRWLLLLTALGGLMAAFLQASRRAPALPVTADVLVTTLSALTTLLLLIRLPTSDGSPLIGAFAGLVAVAGVTTGAFMSLRREDGWVPGPGHPVEQVAVGRAERSA